MKRILLCLMVALFAIGCLLAKNNDEKINVMSYNIRYDNSGDKGSQWKFRRDFVAGLVKFYEADVFGAREVSNNQLNDLLNRLPEYVYVGVGREDGKTKGEYVLISYRKNHFSVEKNGNFWLAEDVNATGKKGWDAACERVATWAILRDKNTGKKFFFSNTHLDHMGKVARHEGASLVLEQAKKLFGNLPIIVAGDFNAVPSDEPIQVLANPSGPRHLTHSRTITGFIYDPEWIFHDFGKIPYDKREWIDYIFVKGNIKVLRHGVLIETSNNLFSSDHCPVISTLILEQESFVCMGKVDVLKKATPLSSEDCLLVMQRPKSGFNFPLHVHMEFELNYLENAAGAIWIVGDSVEEIDDLDLVSIAGGTKHAYSNHKCLCNGIFEITIQFHKSLFDSLINRRHFKTMKDMFDNASSGLVFSRGVIPGIQDELRMLSDDNKPDSFKNLLRLVEILKILSLDKAARQLNAMNTIKNHNNNDTDRLDSTTLYLHEDYQKRITLSEVAKLINMSDASLVRFLKKWMGKTFIDNLNEIRVAGTVCRLTDTSDSISEICYRYGFNNLSNFNRVFKRRRGSTPTEYREKYPRSRFII